MIRAVIFGIQGESLTDEEKRFFERVQPLGFILFERNCQNSPQVKKLINELRECVGRENLKILIDQEGGRISRLNPLYWRHPPAPQDFGDLYEFDPEKTFDAVYDNARLIGHDLSQLGINVNCAPLADLPSEEADPVISDRAFSSYPDVTASLSLGTIQGLQDRGITPVLKHLPGHGRALVDSHKSLPVITASKEALYGHDLHVFKQILTSLNQLLLPIPWGMTAHVVYTAFDKEHPVTLSPTIIDHVIRGYLDFQGFLITDCLTMEALKGTMAERAEQSLHAGCDAVLHCSGHFEEMVEIASVAPILTDTHLEILHDSTPQPPQESIDPITLEKSIKQFFETTKDDIGLRVN